MKKGVGYFILLHMCIKNSNHMSYSSWNTEWNCKKKNHFGPYFTPLITPKIKILKKCKKRPEVLSFAYHEWRSYDVCFLGYKVWQTDVMKKWEKHPEILSLYTCVPQKIIIWCIVPEISSMTNKIFCQFGLFFPLLSH